MEELLDRITIDPKILVGKPTIRGLRISVEQVLRAMAAGITHEEILQEYPELEEEDLRAVLSYALDLVDQEQVHQLAMPA